MLLAKSLEMNLRACIAHIHQEVLGKCAVLNVAQDLLHGLLGLIGDDLRSGDVSAVLSSVGYRIPHSAESGLIDKVYDQLHLVDALEVSVSRIITRLNEGLEACLHKSGNAAAQNCLLTEEIGLCLGLIGSLKKSGACSADGKTVCQRKILCLAGVILLHSDQARSTLSCNIFGTDRMAGCLRSDHGNVNILRRNDAAVMDVEAMSEHEHIAFFQVRLDIFAVQLSLLLIIDQDHDDIRLLRSLSCCINFKALFFCPLPASGTLIQTDDNLAS